MNLLDWTPSHTLTTLCAEPVTIKHDASLQQAIEVASDFVGESIPLLTGHRTLLWRGY